MKPSIYKSFSNFHLPVRYYGPIRGDQRIIGFGLVERTSKTYVNFASRYFVQNSKLSTVATVNADLDHHFASFKKQPTVPQALTLLAAYIREANIDQAFAVYNTLTKSAKPDGSIYVSLLYACFKFQQTQRALPLLDEMIKHNIFPDDASLNYLIAAFKLHQDLQGALKLLNIMAQSPRKYLSIEAENCNALLKLLMERDNSKAAFTLFDFMDKHQITPDAVTYSLLLKACTKGSSPNLAQGMKIYEHALKTGVTERMHVVLTSMIALLGKSGDVKKARKVFEEMRAKKMEMDIQTWSAMISAYTNCGLSKEALALYPELLKANVKPDAFTFTTLVIACGNVGDLTLGKVIHQAILKSLDVPDLPLREALVHMYVKCGNLAEAMVEFNEIRKRKAVRPQVWSAVLTLHNRQGRSKDAIEIYNAVRKEGAQVDDHLFVAVLNACTNVSDIVNGRLIHNEISKRGPLMNDHVATALIKVYMKCGDTSAALVLFEELRKHRVPITVHTWNALLMGYLQNKDFNAVLQLYDQILKESTAIANDITFATAIFACASSGQAELGLKIANMAKMKYTPLTPLLRKAIDGLSGIPIQK